MAMLHTGIGLFAQIVLCKDFVWIIDGRQFLGIVLIPVYGTSCFQRGATINCNRALAYLSLLDFFTLRMLFIAGHVHVDRRPTGRRSHGGFPAQGCAAFDQRRFSARQSRVSCKKNLTRPPTGSCSPPLECVLRTY